MKKVANLMPAHVSVLDCSAHQLHQIPHYHIVAVESPVTQFTIISRTYIISIKDFPGFV